MIQYYGYAYPPHGLITILEDIKFKQEINFYLIDPLTKLEELPYAEIATQDKSNLFVVVQTGEGHSHKEFDSLVNELTSVGVIAKHIVIYTGCLYDPTSLVHSIGTIVPHTGVTWSMINPTVDMLKVMPTHHYVALNRLPRWERWRVVETLLDRNLDKFGRISYGIASENLAEEKIQTFITDKYRHLFPMTIDQDVVSFDQGYSITSPGIAGAMVNIVTESAYDNHPSVKKSFNQQWPTLSEKTYKAFILGQIPLLVAPMRTIQVLREFGFDVFDDVVDHSYDLEEDPELRIQQVIDQVERICQLSVDDLVALKQTLAIRLLNNYNCLQSWAYNYSADVPRWIKYFKEQGVVD